MSEDRGQRTNEFGIGTRRRPIERDYAAAKNGEGGIYLQAQGIRHKA